MLHSPGPAGLAGSERPGAQGSNCILRGAHTALPLEGRPTLEKQKDTESQCSTRRAGGTRRATAAFISRAPSRWTRAP